MADLNCDSCWKTPLGSLARVIVLDQFSRCVFRGTKRAFDYDDITASIVKDIVDKNWLVAEYAPIHRLFLGVAIQHSEDMDMQRIGLHIASQVAVGATAAVSDYIANLKGYPHEHFDVIERFHRFPSRNTALVRFSYVYLFFLHVCVCACVREYFLLCISQLDHLHIITIPPPYPPPSLYLTQGRESTSEEILWMLSPQCPAWAKSQLPPRTSPVLQVGVVAFGLSGRVFHAPFILTHPGFHLAAVCERSKNEGEKFAEAHGCTVQTVRSVEELVALGHISVVVICSPIEFHYAQAKQALEAGKHVLVEKAFCATSKQAHDLLLLAREKGLVCMPYQNRRHDSDFLTLRGILKDNSLGDIVDFNGYFNRYSPRIRDGVWKDTVAGSGGNFLSLGSHMIDQAVLLFGSPTRVWADIRCQRKGGVLDDAWEVHLFYESGGDRADSEGLHKGGYRAILKGSLLCVDHKLRYMVHGTKGSWIKRGIDTQEAYLMTGQLPVYRPPDSSTDDSSDYGREDPSQWGVLSVPGSDEVRTPAAVGSYHAIYDDLYQRIVGITDDHALNSTDIDMVPVVVLKVIELAKLSSRTGQVVDFSLDD